MTITELKDNLIALSLYVQINDIDEEIYVYESKSANMPESYKQKMYDKLDKLKEKVKILNL